MACGPFKFRSKDEQGDKSELSDIGGVDKVTRRIFLFMCFRSERTDTVRSDQRRMKRNKITEVIHCLLGARRTRRERWKRRKWVE